VEEQKEHDLYQPFLTKEKPLSALDKSILELNKTFKTEVATVGATQIYVDKLPFSSPRLNYMTYGGVPIGKATEFFGPEGGGKTTAAVVIVGQAQKKAQSDWEKLLLANQEKLYELEQKDNKSDKKTIEKLKEVIENLFIEGPKRCVYVDAENTLDVEWAEKNGMSVKSVILIRPQDHTAEQVLQIILDLIITGQIECIVIDSLPMLIPNQSMKMIWKRKHTAVCLGLLRYSPKR
jgi:recombination protein RecA